MESYSNINLYLLNFLNNDDGDDKTSQYRNRLLLDHQLDKLQLTYNPNDDFINFIENKPFLLIIHKILKCFYVYDKLNTVNNKIILNKIENKNSLLEIELYSLIKLLLINIDDVLIKQLTKLDDSTKNIQSNLISLGALMQKDKNFFFENDYKYCYKSIKSFFYNKFKWNKKNFVIHKSPKERLKIYRERKQNIAKKQTKKDYDQSPQKEFVNESSHAIKRKRDNDDNQNMSFKKSKDI